MKALEVGAGVGVANGGAGTGVLAQATIRRLEAKITTSRFADIIR
jgi:hypothetical protein